MSLEDFATLLACVGSAGVVPHPGTLCDLAAAPVGVGCCVECNASPV